MKKLLAFCFLTACFFPAFSQIVNKDVDGGLRLNNNDGSLISKVGKFDEDGQTTVPQSNCTAVIKTDDGKTYNKLQGRIDLRTGKLIFTINEEDRICNLPVKEITFEQCSAELSTPVFKNGYPAIEKQSTESFYQVLAEGKATLLKYYVLEWQDQTPFNGTNVTRVYKVKPAYFLLTNNQMQRLDKKNGNLPALLSLSPEYLKKNKPNLSRDEDLIKVISYFNTL